MCTPEERGGAGCDAGNRVLLGFLTGVWKWKAASELQPEHFVCACVSERNDYTFGRVVDALEFGALESGFVLRPQRLLIAHEIVFGVVVHKGIRSPGIIRLGSDQTMIGDPKVSLTCNQNTRKLIRGRSLPSFSKATQRYHNPIRVRTYCVLVFWTFREGGQLNPLNDSPVLGIERGHSSL